MNLVQKVHRLLIYYSSSKIHALLFPCLTFKFKNESRNFESTAPGSLGVDELVSYITNCDVHRK